MGEVPVVESLQKLRSAVQIRAQLTVNGTIGKQGNVMSHVEVECEQIQELPRLMHNMEVKSVLDHQALLKAAMNKNVQLIAYGENGSLENALQNVVEELSWILGTRYKKNYLVVNHAKENISVTKIAIPTIVQ